MRHLMRTGSKTAPHWAYLRATEAHRNESRLINAVTSSAMTASQGVLLMMKAICVRDDANSGIYVGEGKEFRISIGKSTESSDTNGHPVRRSFQDEAKRLDVWLSDL